MDIAKTMLGSNMAGEVDEMKIVLTPCLSDESKTGVSIYNGIDILQIIDPVFMWTPHPTTFKYHAVPDIETYKLIVDPSKNGKGGEFIFCNENEEPVFKLPYSKAPHHNTWEVKKMKMLYQSSVLDLYRIIELVSSGVSNFNPKVSDTNYYEPVGMHIQNGLVFWLCGSGNHCAFGVREIGSSVPDGDFYLYYKTVRNWKKLMDLFGEETLENATVTLYDTSYYDTPKAIFHQELDNAEYDLMVDKKDFENKDLFHRFSSFFSTLGSVNAPQGVLNIAESYENLKKVNAHYYANNLKRTQDKNVLFTFLVNDTFTGIGMKDAEFGNVRYQLFGEFTKALNDRQFDFLSFYKYINACMRLGIVQCEIQVMEDCYCFYNEDFTGFISFY